MGNEILIAVVILGVTGLAMGLFLAFASKKFEVCLLCTSDAADEL